MYTLEYLPIAKKDMIEISQYIGVKLSNPAAADNLAEKMVAAAENLTDMPYKCSVYISPRPLKFEYRKFLVGNYIMFYYIDEDRKIVTIARVLYAKRDFRKLLT